ncbi:hypothetical protein VNO77_24966 [Canavalia gladiata]|uniref:C2H2-type domain-containing protein n=1 Tax=Canavalia gladiata TaxID=3824 RepID=A0AAN9QD42_CANGL
MERHKCKLCSRSFANGRALGGHMKAHLAALPLPPKPQTLTDSVSLSYSSSSSSSSESEEEEEKALIYELRENPKKSFKVADPEFSSFAPDTASVVVQDRESETESKNPTRQRSKRNRKSSFMVSTTPTTEPEPVSSVSDTSPEEDVAMCLMMLSRDRWKGNINNNVAEERSKGRCKNKEINKFKKVRGKHLCENCGKAFRSSRALVSHTSVCCHHDEAMAKGEGNNNNNNSKIFECPFCYKVFGSGQALGGHKRSHLIPSSSSALKFKESFIDLNLPAPVEEDDLSVVSDA